MKKILAIANTIALIFTISVNYLSNTGLINGETMKSISDRYANYFTPAGYAFSIWGVIYLGLLGFIFYGWKSLSDKNNQVVSKIGWWFVISCFANSLWVVAWLYDQIGLSVVIMILIFISLLKIIISADITGQRHVETSTKLLVHWPFAIYFGWISVALIADVAAFLTKLSWNGWGISGITWTIIMLCIAGAVNLAIIYARQLPAFGLVGAWAVTAISVANQNSGINSIVYTCYAVAAVILVFVAVTTFSKKPAMHT